MEEKQAEAKMATMDEGEFRDRMGQPIVGMNCIKSMLCLSNFIFIMVGFVLISIGATIYTVYSYFDLFLGRSYFSPSILLMLTGLVLVVVSIVGIFGTLRESSCSVMSFAAVLSVLLLIELSITIITFSTTDVQELIGRNMHRALIDYKTDTYAEESVDFLQISLDCCGEQSINDWSTPDVNYTSVDNWPYPRSCCQVTNGLTCVAVREQPCLNKLVYLIYEGEILLGTGAMTFAILQVLGIVFSVNLAKAIRLAKTHREVKRWIEDHPGYDQ